MSTKRKKSLQEFFNFQKKVVNIDEKLNNDIKRLMKHERKISLQLPIHTDKERKISIQSPLTALMNKSRKQSSIKNPQLVEKPTTPLPIAKKREVKALLQSPLMKRGGEIAKQDEREKRVSMTEVIKNAVVSKRRYDLEQPKSPSDENNNSERKSKWERIKHHGKIENRNSIDEIENSNSFTYERNDSVSSVSSISSKKRFGKNLQSPLRSSARSFEFNRSVSGDFDQRSAFSLSSVLFDTTPSDNKIASSPFDPWSEVNKEEYNTPPPLLHVAASEGNLELLKILQRVGVDINELDESGWPALHYAICSGHFEAAQFLINKGAAIKPYSDRVVNKYCSAVRECITH